MLGLFPTFERHHGHVGVTHPPARTTVQALEMKEITSPVVPMGVLLACTVKGRKQQSNECLAGVVCLVTRGARCKPPCERASCVPNPPAPHLRLRQPPPQPPCVPRPRQPPSPLSALHLYQPPHAPHAHQNVSTRPLSHSCAPSSLALLAQETCPCAWANDLSRSYFGERGVQPPSQTLSLCVYNMLIVSTSSRSRLLGAESVYRPQTAMPVCPAHVTHARPPAPNNPRHASCTPTPPPLHLVCAKAPHAPRETRSADPADL